MSTEVKEITEPPLLATVPTASYLLSISQRQVYLLVEQKRLELVKIGPKGTRITRDSIMRLAAERAAPSSHVANLKQFSDTAETETKKKKKRRTKRK